MGILYTIIIGFLVGLLARFIKPGADNYGFIVTTLVAIAGAFLGAFIGQAFGIYTVGEPAGFIGAVAGAIIVLVIMQAASRKRLV